MVEPPCPLCVVGGGVGTNAHRWRQALRCVHRNILVAQGWVLNGDLPTNFRKSARLGLPQFAYMPFGGGPHKCIGEGFAWMEARVALAPLGRRWRAATSSKAKIMPRTTLKVKGGLPMVLERRPLKRWEHFQRSAWRTR